MAEEDKPEKEPSFVRAADVWPEVDRLLGLESIDAPLSLVVAFPGDFGFVTATVAFRLNRTQAIKIAEIAARGAVAAVPVPASEGGFTTDPSVAEFFLVKDRDGRFVKHEVKPKE